MAKDAAITRTELLPGTLEMLILKSLQRNDEPMHGYGIAAYIKQISRNANTNVPPQDANNLSKKWQALKKHWKQFRSSSSRLKSRRREH